MQRRRWFPMTYLLKVQGTCANVSMQSPVCPTCPPARGAIPISFHWSKALQECAGARLTTRMPRCNPPKQGWQKGQTDWHPIRANAGLHAHGLWSGVTCGASTGREGQETRDWPGGCNLDTTRYGASPVEAASRVWVCVVFVDHHAQVKMRGLIFSKVIRPLARVTGACPFQAWRIGDGPPARPTLKTPSSSNAVCVLIQTVGSAAVRPGAQPAPPLP